MLGSLGLGKISYGREVLQSERDILIIPLSRLEERILLVHVITDRRCRIQNENLVKEFVPRQMRGHGNERMHPVCILDIVSLKDMEEHEVIGKAANTGAHLP